MKINPVMRLNLISISVTLLVVSGLFGCNSSLIGTYEAINPKFSTGRFTIGNKLILKSDSTFFYETCGDISNGTWKTDLSNDSVILYCRQFKYKNDSLNKIKSTHCTSNEPFEKFRILSNSKLMGGFDNVSILLRRTSK